jgi:hypothetical protein
MIPVPFSRFQVKTCPWALETCPEKPKCVMNELCGSTEAWRRTQLEELNIQIHMRTHISTQHQLHQRELNNFHYGLFSLVTLRI